MAHVCDIMASSGRRGAKHAVHSPSQELKETLYNAAYHDGAHGLHASAGMAIVTAGAAHAQPLAPSLHARRGCCRLAPQGYAHQQLFIYNTHPFHHSALEQTLMKMPGNALHLAGFLSCTSYDAAAMLCRRPPPLCAAAAEVPAGPEVQPGRRPQSSRRHCWHDQRRQVTLRRPESPVQPPLRPELCLKRA